jgi:nicotinamide riboside transporter PnuC
MSKKSSGGLETVAIVVFLALMGFIGLIITNLVMLFLIPIVGWYVWRLNQRARELEKRVATIEKAEPKSEEA